ncbi:uncharacterized protein L203_103574 [Cryptococcus depauperatus CBS 7841]|uniref:Wbp11/ELF5/Saf1 N-terminal domain-containing protein n=1 Tax=Cryptococcus depauperatus CBS 7841 TaxID=1295531 RepID=A0A1E3IKI6_9TREE|nr:hypothetical protein L203_02829 [Cryptococcus depauperatus CBS 7841]
MAKKSHNPADAYRKQLKAKELKKNKEARQKARDNQTAKKNTRELEAELRSLQSLNDQSNKNRIAELEKELKYINKLKEKHVAEHPEDHDKIYHIRRKTEHEDEDAEGSSSGAGYLYDEMGRLRDPKKSVYYDPVYNPFGVPPPGMPYKEKTPEEESEDDSDSDIVMPEGPPPENSDGSDESDDLSDIPLPEGPPPPKPVSAHPPPPIPSGPPFPSHPPGFPQSSGAPPFYPQPPPMSIPLPWGQLPPQPQSQPFRPNVGFRPPASRTLDVTQTSSNPQNGNAGTPYQAQRITQANLPVRPATSNEFSSTVSNTKSTSASAEISAEPVLRDLRKEATVFIPRGIKRRQGQTGSGGTGGSGVGRVVVNAAPGGGEIDEDGDQLKRKEARVGLMSKLSGVLGAPDITPSTTTKTNETSKNVDDDYQKFLEGLKDLT